MQSNTITRPTAKPLSRLYTAIALIGAVFVSTPSIAATSPSATPKGIMQVPALKALPNTVCKMV